MAQYVLGQQRQWNADTIQDALQPGPTRHVYLIHPILVVISYATATVDSEGREAGLCDGYLRPRP